MIKALWMWGVFFVLSVVCVQSQSSPPGYRTGVGMRGASKTPEIFKKNRLGLQITSGALASPVGIGPDTDTFNYTMHNLRLSWVLNDPKRWNHPLNGAVEAIVEVSGSGIFEGAGNYLIGPTLLLRYNFIQPDWVIVPFIQAGAGLTFTDAYEDETQRAIGQELEFTPQASLGARYLIDDHWTVDAEFIYHHISNAGLADRNLGINALGGMIGISYYFGAP